MAIIYTYPTKTNPVGDDLILISDSADKNNTKQVKVSTLPSFGGGSVSSVGFSLNSIAAFTVTGDNPVTGSGTITLGTTGGSSGQYLDYQGNWSTPTDTTVSPSLPLNSIQFNSASSFSGNDELTYNGVGGLTVGAIGGNKGIVTLQPEDGNDSGILKIGHLNNTEYLSLGLGNDTMAASYSIDFPVAAPGGNNKILESNSSGVLSWINTPSGSSGISFNGSTADGIATYSSATTANVSSNLTIDNSNLKLNIGSKYSIQDSSNVFKIGSLSSTQDQEAIEFHINGSRKVIINEDGRLVASVGSAASPNLKLGAGNDGVYGTTNTVQLITNGTSKISISDGNTADIQMNDLVEFGYGLRFGATGETLSSYEEGTWAPVMFQSANPSVTATGYYIKIGRKVTAFFTLVCTQGGEAEISNARISGLPFNANSSNGYKAGVSIAQNTANAVNQKFIGGAPGGATTVDLKVFTSGTDYQYNQGRWPNTQGNFTVSGSYTYHAQS